METHERIIRVREILKLNQKDFGEKLGLSKSAANALEIGRRQPSRETLIIMAEKLNINITWILTGYGEMFLEQNTFTEPTTTEIMNLLNSFILLDETKRNDVFRYIKSISS